MSDVFGARDSIADDVLWESDEGEDANPFLDSEFEEALALQGIRRSAVIESDGEEDSGEEGEGDESEAESIECETASEASEASEARHSASEASEASETSLMDEEDDGVEDSGEEGEGEEDSGEETDTLLSGMSHPKEVTPEKLASLLARVGVLESNQQILLGAHDGRFLLDLVEAYAAAVPEAVSSGDLLRASTITHSMYKNAKAIEKMFNSTLKLAVVMAIAGEKDLLANTLRAMENNEVAILVARAEKVENELELAKEQLMVLAEKERLLEEKVKLLEGRENLSSA
jgi:hypothetical protein